MFLLVFPMTHPAISVPGSTFLDTHIRADTRTHTRTHTRARTHAHTQARMTRHSRSRARRAIKRTLKIHSRTHGSSGGCTKDVCANDIFVCYYFLLHVQLKLVQTDTRTFGHSARRDTRRGAALNTRGNAPRNTKAYIYILYLRRRGEGGGEKCLSFLSSRYKVNSIFFLC